MTSTAPHTSRWWRSCHPIVLFVGALVLAVAAFAAPAHVVSICGGDAAVGPAFVDFWGSRDGAVGPDLSRIVNCWRWFHVLKAVIAAALLLVLGVSEARLRDAARRAASTPRRVVLGASWVLGAALCLLAFLIVIANVQGAVAPLSSVLNLLPRAGSDPQLTVVFGQIERELRVGGRPPALDTLLHDFASYHAAMAVLAGATAAILSLTGGLLWIKRAGPVRDDSRARQAFAAGSFSIGLLAAGFAVLAAANLSTVANTAPALLGFFEGGGL